MLKLHGLYVAQVSSAENGHSDRHKASNMINGQGGGSLHGTPELCIQNIASAGFNCNHPNVDCALRNSICALHYTDKV
jgi:hypothetical protein